MSKPVPLGERCPECGRRLYATYRTGLRITQMVQTIDDKQPPQRHRTVMCLNLDCGYGREESGPFPLAEPEAPAVGGLRGLLRRLFRRMTG
jgi:hypothetical protein